MSCYLPPQFHCEYLDITLKSFHFFFHSPPEAGDDFIMEYLIEMANQLNTVTAYLTQIPNQPIVFSVSKISISNTSCT